MLNHIVLYTAWIREPRITLLVLSRIRINKTVVTVVVKSYFCCIRLSRFFSTSCIICERSRVYLFEERYYKNTGPIILIHFIAK